MTQEKFNALEKNQKNLSKKIDFLKKQVLDFEKLIISKDYKIEILQSKVNDLKESIEKIIEKIQKFEIKMESIHIRTAESENKWSSITDFIVKIFWVLIVSYLLYKLGIQGPPA